MNTKSGLTLGLLLCCLLSEVASRKVKQAEKNSDDEPWDLSELGTVDDNDKVNEWLNQGGNAWGTGGGNAWGTGGGNAWGTGGGNAWDNGDGNAWDNGDGNAWDNYEANENTYGPEDTWDSSDLDEDIEIGSGSGSVNYDDPWGIWDLEWYDTEDFGSGSGITADDDPWDLSDLEKKDSEYLGSGSGDINYEDPWGIWDLEYYDSEDFGSGSGDVSSEEPWDLTELGTVGGDEKVDWWANQGDNEWYNGGGNNGWYNGWDYYQPNTNEEDTVVEEQQVDLSDLPEKQDLSLTGVNNWSQNNNGDDLDSAHNEEQLNDFIVDDVQKEKKPKKEKEGNGKEKTQDTNIKNILKASKELENEELNALLAEVMGLDAE